MKQICFFIIWMILLSLFAGEQPWKDAFERLKASTNLQFEVKPYAHVIRGPYGKPNIGGDDLRNGSEMAYNYNGYEKSSSGNSNVISKTF